MCYRARARGGARPTWEPKFGRASSRKPGSSHSAASSSSSSACRRRASPRPRRSPRTRPRRRDSYPSRRELGTSRPSASMADPAARARAAPQDPSPPPPGTRRSRRRTRRPCGACAARTPVSSWRGAAQRRGAPAGLARADAQLARGVHHPPAHQAERRVAEPSFGVGVRRMQRRRARAHRRGRAPWPATGRARRRWRTRPTRARGLVPRALVPGEIADSESVERGRDRPASRNAAGSVHRSAPATSTPSASRVIAARALPSSHATTRFARNVTGSRVSSPRGCRARARRGARGRGLEFGSEPVW